MDMMSLRPAHLRRIKSLALLTDSELDVFLTHIELVVCPHSGILFKEGQRADAMFLVLEGELRVFSRQREGEVLFLRLLAPGDAFGEIALLNRGPRTASVEALRESLLVKISAAALQKLVKQEPVLAAQFLYHLARSLGQQLGDLTKRLRAQREFAEMVNFIQ